MPWPVPSDPGTQVLVAPHLQCSVPPPFSTENASFMCNASEAMSLYNSGQRLNHNIVTTRPFPSFRKITISKSISEEIAEGSWSSTHYQVFLIKTLFLRKCLCSRKPCLAAIRLYCKKNKLIIHHFYTYKFIYLIIESYLP